MGEREPGVRESFQGSTPRTPEGEDIAEGTPSEREPRCPAPPEGKPHSLAPSLVEKGMESLSEYRSGCYPAESPRAIQSELTPDQRNRCCIAGSGATALVDAGLIAQLVSKLESEHDEIQELILETLHFCLQADASQALNAGAVPILKGKLSHLLVGIRRKAACALLEICVPLEGKESVCKAEVVPIFVQLLEDEDAEVRANAAGALMFTTITTQGKYAALHSGAIPKLLALVKDSHSKVRLNCIKALTTLSETPEGRKVLLPDVNLIQECLSDSSEAVSRAAAIAVQVIQWKP